MCDIHSDLSLVSHRKWGSRYPLALVYLEAYSPLCPCFFCSVDWISKIELHSTTLGACEVSSLWSQRSSWIHCVLGYLQSRGMTIALCFSMRKTYSWESLKSILILCLGSQPVQYSLLFYHLPFSSLSIVFAFWSPRGKKRSSGNYFMRFVS